jgi:natural product precursor
MKKLNLSLGSVKEMLSKEQMKFILGGDGTCACGDADVELTKNLSKQEAIDCATENHGHWCCDSCESASWWCETEF